MRTEAPVLKRCCVCLPLRYGLMAWAFYHLIIDIVLLSFALVTLYEVVMVYDYITEPQLVVYCIFIAVLLIDIALNTTFIIGAHKFLKRTRTYRLGTREVNLLKIYFIYNVVLWVLAALLTMFLIGFTIYAMASNVSSIIGCIFIVILGSIAFSMLVYIVIQTYFLLLIRSEIIKLNNNSNFQFVNNAADATCTLNMQYMDYMYTHNDIENNPIIIKNEMQDDHVVEICEKDNGTCASKTCCIVELNGERLT